MRKLVAIIIMVVLIFNCSYVKGNNDCIPTKSLNIISTHYLGELNGWISSFVFHPYKDVIIYRTRYPGAEISDFGQTFLECRKLDDLELVWEYKVKATDLETASGFLYANELIEIFDISDPSSTSCKYNCYCINIQTGELVWEKKDYWCLEANENYLLFSDHKNNKIEYIKSNNMLWAIDKRENTAIYEIEETKNEIYLLLGLSDKTNSDGNLVSIDTKNGEFLWEKTIPLDMDLSLGEGFIYGYMDFSIICIDTKTGDQLWNVTNIVKADEIFAYEKYVYVKNTDKGITCLDSHSGDIIWQFDYQSPYIREDGHQIDEFYNLDTTIHDGKLLIVPSPWEKLLVVDPATGVTLECFKIEIGSPLNNGDTYFFHFDKAIMMNSVAVVVFDIPSITTTLKFTIDVKEYSLDDVKRPIDVAPLILNGRTFLPARYVTEPLGGDVSWDGVEKKVVCELGENVVELWIGKSTAKVNGVEVQIDPNNPDVVPTIISDRTMVPMRFLAESLGCEVEWIAETKEIVLIYSP